MHNENANQMQGTGPILSLECLSTHMQSLSQRCGPSHPMGQNPSRASPIGINLGHTEFKNSTEIKCVYTDVVKHIINRDLLIMLLFNVNDYDLSERI